MVESKEDKRFEKCSSLELNKSEFVGIGIQENIQKITHLWG